MKVPVVALVFLTQLWNTEATIPSDKTCVCAYNRQPVLSAPHNHAHIETYIEAGHCLKTAMVSDEPWASVLFDRHLALETFSAIGVIRKTGNVFYSGHCPKHYPGPITCHSGPCLHGKCHTRSFKGGISEWCICDPGYTGADCGTAHNCSSPMISLAGVCWDPLNPKSMNNNYGHVPEYHFNGTLYSLNDDCVVSTSSDSHIRGVYCHCGEEKAFLFSNHSVSICGCKGGQLKKLDGLCIDANLCMLSDYCVHGTCLNNTLIPSCMCDHGYTGVRCDTPFQSCDRCRYCNAKRCDHGICLAGFRCHCDVGWTGDSCDVVQSCTDGYSMESKCFPYEKDYSLRPCVTDVCEECFLYPFTKSGVICGGDLDNGTIVYHLLDGTVVKPLDKDHTLQGCFPPNSVVISVSNSTIVMKNLRIGDEILAVDERGKLIFTKVILMLHKDSKQELKYRLLYTTSGQHIEISDEHLIYTAKNKNDKFKVKAAGNLKTGDYIQYYNQIRQTLSAAKILRIDEKIKAGMYAPLTESGNLIVDNHVASAYATFEDQEHVHLIFAPWRLAYKLSTWLWGEQIYEADESGVHWSLKGFFMFGKLRCYLFNEEFCKHLYY